MTDPQIEPSGTEEATGSSRAESTVSGGTLPLRTIFTSSCNFPRADRPYAYEGQSFEVIPGPNRGTTTRGE